jgi:transcriptional regulator with XRE-family HTH domain
MTTNTTQPSHQPIGPMLRAWRSARGKSQLALASEAGVSTRHLSFLETGRASPSREMVLTLAEHLEVPLRDRNLLLQAAGFAAVYSETPLDAPTMSEVRGALQHILQASEPNPTLVVNRRYDILLANDAAVQLLSFFAPSWRGRNNLALMLLAHEGLRPAVLNWPEVASHVVQRLRGELSTVVTRDRADEEMLARAIATAGELRDAAHDSTRPPAILIPVKLQREALLLELFTTITTLGTPLDITLQELRIETLFPANERSRTALGVVTSPLADPDSAS